MKEINRTNNPYNDDKMINACSLFGVMDTSGRRFPGKVSLGLLPICMFAAMAWVEDLLSTDCTPNMLTSTPST